MSFNKIIIVGNLGRDPELRYTPQGTAVCSFSVATSERKRGNSGDQQEVTTWFRVTLWDKKAEVASKYLTKGSPVYIEGRLRMEEYTDRDGKQRQSLEVQATEMQFIGSNRPAEEGGYSGGGRSDSYSGGGDSPRSESRAAAPRSAPAASRDYDDFDQSGGAGDEDIPF